MIAQLHHLLSQSAGWVDVLKDESSTPDQVPPVLTTTFIAYWLNCNDFEEWRQEILKPFWDGLPDDAGVWREIMTVPKSRHLYSTSQPVATGIASMVGLTVSSDMGYWGVYRHRIAQNKDQYTDPSDKFSSPYASKPSSKAGDGKKLVNLETSYPNTIRRGQFKISKIPEDFCFVREMQSLLGASEEELQNWRDTLKPPFRSWVDHLATERNKNGIVSFSTHLAQQSHHGQDCSSEASDSILPEAHQLLYCLDLADFELSGRSFKEHIALRNATMTLYGPGGRFFGRSKLHLVVEVSVLKSTDLEAEYIGCREGTRLRILEDQ
ncbi:hypothetical protein NW754_001422 [Fusarium falciforme]|nr:hypothetical protein NW754_001422 [Fusarium falciforme]KAJ4176533.1 hypothetical protein NW767_015419 [Fusarium falciforme]KAJ4182057.1 hypothetical protein NW759_017157 [Fusarium solani]